MAAKETGEVGAHEEGTASAESLTAWCVLIDQKNYPSMLRHCIHSLYFSTGIRQLRCRLPGMSTLSLTPFGTSDREGWREGGENTQGFVPMKGDNRWQVIDNAAKYVQTRFMDTTNEWPLSQYPILLS